MSLSLNSVRGPLLRAVAMAVGFVATAGSLASAGWNPFSHGTPIEVDSQSGQLAMADFTGDGKVDILVSYPLQGKVSVLAGDGSGGFPMAGRSTIELGYDPGAIATGELNGDQIVDLAIVARDDASARVHILLGKLGEAFEEMTELAVPVAQTFEKGWKPTLKLVDINGDSYLDLVAANRRQETIELFLGNGSGAFATGRTVDLPDRFHDYTHVLDDLNGDARPDIIAVCAPLDEGAPAQLAVLLADEQGPFVPAKHLASSLPARAYVKTLADIDGDKFQDIVLTHGQQITVLAQAKNGSLAPSVGTPFDLGREAFGMVALNVGYAGNDVLVAATADSLEVIFADEDGRFRHACDTPMKAGPGAYQVATGDINGDGQLDVVTNCFEGNQLTVLLSNQ